MSRFLLLFSQVVLLVSAWVSSEDSSEKQKSTCQNIDGYNVCHYEGVLVEVTQLRFEDRLDNREDRLYISNLDLLAIQEDAFKNVTATHLYLNEGNRISNVKRGSFRGLPKLKHLHLGNNVVTLSEHLFAELGEHLQTLTLYFNKIDLISKDSFAGLSNLMWLFLICNDIEAIDAKSFSNLNVELLNLGHNKISHIAPGTFAGLTELIYLDLEYNQLTGLPSDAFRGLNKLEDLYLNNNRITSVSRELLRDLVGLKNLYLQQNEISALEPETFRDLYRLELLRLDGNKLSHIVVGTFAGLSNLKYINLSNNNIRTVDNGAFADFVNVRYLSFGGNDLTAINRETSGLPYITDTTEPWETIYI
ncbi:leucine-rich repeat transmembrane neuronal protein 4 isoform X1 [Solenopsis invicta]|uniref:leucine-rich repeat transmembrane neuronal protein 4 isoform X1 n=1 Tax=Solenopsis invicta TaxID=13686 RepID=UPI000595A8C8|nr:leucine-rich repeat transmembrane neuronal protein 4 isoform X1 [Solenopsis invicta]